MIIKHNRKTWGFIARACLLSIVIPYAKAHPSITMAPTTPTTIQNPNSGTTLLEYPVNNDQKNLPTVSTRDPNFPYGSSPTGNVCVSTDYYATPETMLGSWAMIQALTMDAQESVLPGFLSGTNTVYAVGTAAIGDQLGIANCSTGCNELNGYCFALKFANKTVSGRPITPTPLR
jgi:hypothetical protein